ncbi:hypothetical protein [Faecalibacterium prausnitzii]|uniref:hypothetical protein n=1 Tax=Faecalibacterium prausnitzii TaxID=853 RepID=UPI001CBD7E3B|nr:hypothetical protein [Faecalibacterium prausnitzii]
MLSLYFCRAVRVDCPASYMRRRQIIEGITFRVDGQEKLANPVNTMMCFEEALKDHAYILKMIEARILVEHGLLKEYNFDTAKIDTRRENIKSVFDSVCNRKHTDQEIQKAYEEVLNVDIEGIQVNPFKALYSVYSRGIAATTIPKRSGWGMASSL